MSHENTNGGFEFSDAEFPLLNNKMTGKREKGRRCIGAALQHARKIEKSGTCLVKTIEDNDNILGKQKRDRVSSAKNDGFAPYVQYSINKQNRWDTVNANNLLENSSEIKTNVVEHLIVGNRFQQTVAALHTTDDDGNITVQRAKGNGTNINALIIGEGKKMRGRRYEKEEEQKALEAELNGTTSSIEKQEPTVSINYNIFKPHKSQKVIVGKLFGRRYSAKRGGKARTQMKRDDSYEIDGSDLEQSVHIDDAVYKPSRDLKFCLGDYITDSQKITKSAIGAVFVRRQSIEGYDTSSETNESDENKPFFLLDISGITKAPAVFEWTVINTSKWKDFSFSKQISELAENEKLVVQWLDMDKRRASIDASQMVNGSDIYSAYPSLIIVIERSINQTTKEKTLRVLLNSDKTSSSQFSWRNLKSLLKDAQCVNEIVEKLTELVRGWSQNKFDENAINIHRKTRFELKRDNYQPMYNSFMLARNASVLTPKIMASLVRDECRYENDTDEFERISTDEEHEATVKAKCVACDNTNVVDLFELDDFWQCRKCLYELIVEKIRAKSVPLEIPFVVNEGQSAYDILPAIISLPLLNFYTMLSAKEVIENSDISLGDLAECPSCKNTVQIDNSNEFNIYNCSNCGVHWCPDCGSEPHWPMSCSQFSAWIGKWETEYSIHYPERVEKMRKSTCKCGNVVHTRLEVEKTQCPVCDLIFHPITPSVVTFLDILPSEIVATPKIIKKEFSDLCGQARHLRFSISAKNDFEKCVRKLKRNYTGAEKLGDIRKAVLFVVENGLAYVYNKQELVELKSNLSQLMKHWSEIEVEVEHPRTDFANRIAAMESNLQHSIELIKATFV